VEVHIVAREPDGKSSNQEKFISWKTAQQVGV
jgi:hypothetical protein